MVTTIAGQCGTPAYADGVGVNARFRSPSDVAVDDRRGRIIVADRENCRIRTLTPLAGTIRPRVTLGQCSNVSFRSIFALLGAFVV